MAYIFDTFVNFMSGLGVAGRDKMTGFRYAKPIWTREQLEASFQSDWIARKAIAIPAMDSVREWRSWQAEQPQIEALEATEKRLQVQQKLQEALIKSRLYGGACILIGVDGDMASELDPEKIGKDGLKFLHVFAPHQLVVQEMIRDIDNPYYGQPMFYTLHDSKGSIGSVNIHPSRMVRLIGLDPPDQLQNYGWGDPMLQVIHDAVSSCGTVMQSMATMIAEAKIDVIKIPGLTEIFSTSDGTNRMIKRFTEANVAKSVINAVLVDGEEDWQRIQVQFRGMPEVMQMYLNIAAGAADIPVTRFLGQSPGGLNATGDSDLQNYYNRISSDQELRLSPALEKLDKVIQRSSLGKSDPNVFYEWNSLWEMSDTEKASIALSKAQATSLDVNSGLIPFDALAKGKANQLIEDGTYPGLESAMEESAIDEDMIAEHTLTKHEQALLPPPSGMGGQVDEEEPVEAEDSMLMIALRTLLDEWTEELHPRGQPDNPGKFGPGGGHASPKAKAAKAGAAARIKQALGFSNKPMGSGYSESAKLKNGVIHTDNVYDAVLALSQDRAVELKQPKQVSTLIKALGEVTKNMVEEGEKAPNFDLRKVTVKGTNLFCADSKGIPRVKMPQMDDDQTKKFVKLLSKQGYKVEKDTEKSEHLRATQAQLDAAKVNKFYKRIREDKNFKGDDKRLVVSKDDYVLDGHHHWAAQIAADAQDNKLGNHHTKVYRVDIPIIPLYELAMKFTGGKGAKGQGDSITWGGVTYLWLDALGTWTEALHPRGQPKNAGQFGPGGGSAKGKKGRSAHEAARARALAKAAVHLTKAGKAEGRERQVRPKSFLTKMSNLVVAGRTNEAEAMMSEATARRQARMTAAESARREKYKVGKKPAVKGDFDKAKIRIGSGSDEATFIKGWNDKIGIDPETFKHDFLGGVNATMSVSKEGSKFVVNGSILGSGSTSVGTYTRNIDPDRKYAYSAFFQLNKGAQHGDIGKKVLAGNIETYEKLGIETVGVTANIDVGGYAWAKYGYVPTPSAWEALRSDLTRKINRASGKTASSVRGGRGDNMQEAEEWSWLSSDTQDEVRDRWMSDSRDEFLNSEIDNWRDSGQALEQAKRDVVDTFDDDTNTPEWVDEAITEAREARKEDGGQDYPFTNNQLYLALKAQEYSSRYDDGRDDIEFEFKDSELKEPKGYDWRQQTLPGIEPVQPHEMLTDEMRTEITDHVSKAANDRAESNASDVEPPSYLGDQVEEYQQEYWDSMDDRQMLEHAERYDLNYYEAPPPDEDDEDYVAPEPEPAPQHEMKMGQTEDEKLLEILASSNPKSIWKFADQGGKAKKLLLGSGWQGRLNLKDPEAYARFKAYVGRAKEKPSGVQA